MKSVGNIAPTGIRMPEELKRRLKQAAKDEGRSLNSEVVKRLERSFIEEVPNGQ
ncbi:Arc family DNA-binding protein [Symbiopectobacterium purcellii]|uniref:Arc family DNA-binding protein n=1 Tax=Symbiopectobacterium purcellii TaxID=2871826 RepID=UPI003F855EE4